MSARTKSILIIVSAVLVGVLIGALAVGAIMNHRADQLQQLRRPAGFAEVVENVIRPGSPEQREEIRDILQRSAERNVELRRTMRQRHVALLDSLRYDLNEVLTPEQMDRLEDWVEHQRRPMRGFRDERRERRRGSPGP